MDELRSASRRELHTNQGDLSYHALTAVPHAASRLAELPHTLKILLENLLRRSGGRDVSDFDVSALATWPAETRAYVPAVLALAGAGPRRARLVR